MTLATDAIVEKGRSESGPEISLSTPADFFAADLFFFVVQTTLEQRHGLVFPPGPNQGVDLV